MHVLSVSSLKGGVGKTTVALGLASAALNKGLNTLLIDLDPQSDATSGLAVTSEFGASVADVLQNPKLPVIRRAIVTSNWSKASRMDVLVGSPKSLLLDHPAPSLADVWKLEEVLTQLEDEYDLVIIDTPPSINALTRTAWVASDRVLLVTEPSLYSVIAADRARKAIQEISAKITPRLELLGLVVNRFRPQSTEHEFRLKELREMFGEQILTPTLKSVLLFNRQQVQQDQFTHGPQRAPPRLLVVLTGFFRVLFRIWKEFLRSETRVLLLT